MGRYLCGKGQEESDVFINGDDLASYFIFADVFDEDALGITGQVSPAEEWFRRGKKMEAEGQFELAIRYYHKARTMKEADRCMALLEFESGNHHYAIDRLTELEEYALAFELAAKIQDKDKMAINKILSAKQNAKEIDDEYII